jgi:hypothetical protein
LGKKGDTKKVIILMFLMKLCSYIDGSTGQNVLEQARQFYRCYRSNRIKHYQTRWYAGSNSKLSDQLNSAKVLVWGENEDPLCSTDKQFVNGFIL